MADHEDTDMQPEYDFSGGVRGKFKDRFPPGSLSSVDPELLKRFPNPQAVEDALRAYLKIQEAVDTARLPTPPQNEAS